MDSVRDEEERSQITGQDGRMADTTVGSVLRPAVWLQLGRRLSWLTIVQSKTILRVPGSLLKHPQLQEVGEMRSLQLSTVPMWDETVGGSAYCCIHQLFLPDPGLCSICCSFCLMVWLLCHPSSSTQAEENI